jgi:hypothetical protein
VLVVSFHCFWVSSVVPETNDFEAIVHASDQKVILAVLSWVPLDAPSTTAYIGLH